MSCGWISAAAAAAVWAVTLFVWICISLILKLYFSNIDRCIFQILSCQCIFLQQLEVAWGAVTRNSTGVADSLTTLRQIGICLYFSSYLLVCFLVFLLVFACIFACICLYLCLYFCLRSCDEKFSRRRGLSDDTQANPCIPSILNPRIHSAATSFS